MVIDVLNIVTDLALLIVFIFGFRELKALRTLYAELLAKQTDPPPPPEPQLSKEEAEQVERNQKLMQALIDEYLG